MGRGFPLTDEEKLRIVELLEKGEERETIAKKVGVSKASVYRVRSEFYGKDIRSMDTVIAGDKTNGTLTCTGPNHYVGTCLVKGGKMKKRHFSVQGSDNAKAQWETWKASLHDNCVAKKEEVSMANNDEPKTMVNNIYILAVGNPQIMGWFVDERQAAETMRTANEALKFAGVDIRYSVQTINRLPK